MIASNFQEARRLMDAGQAVEIPMSAFYGTAPANVGGTVAFRKTGPGRYSAEGEKTTAATRPATKPAAPKPVVRTAKPMTQAEKNAAALQAGRLRRENEELRRQVDRVEELHRRAKAGDNTARVALASIPR